MSVLRDDYLSAVLAGDGVRARHVVDEAVVRGMPVAEAYLGILQPAMAQIGELWASGDVGVGFEHYATTVTQGILGTLAPRMRVTPTTGRLAVLACTPGERHSLGVQMVGDFVEGAGWEVLNLGASLPVGELVGLVHAEQPDVVGLSTATPDRLAGAEAALAALRELDPALYLVVGGQAWDTVAPGEARELGADGRFEDPVAFVRMLGRLFPPAADAL